MAAAAILDCRIHKILLTNSVWTAQTHHCTKFHQNRLFLCGDIAILRIFKMAAAAILDFRNREFFFADGIWRAQMQNFCQNRSSYRGDITIFRIFKMAATAILDF